MNKYEQLIEYIINDEEAKAKELFHQIVVGKSREIYQELLAEDFSKDTGNPYSSSEEKEEDQTERAKFEADTVGQETKQVEHLDGIGKTLIASLETHKQMLELLKGGAGGGSGGSMLDTAMDVAGSMGKRGGGMLSKAGGFLARGARLLGPGALAAGAAFGIAKWIDGH